MKTLIYFLLLIFIQPVFGQAEPGEIPKEDFERPFNYFAAAGASYRFGDLYNVVASPIDYTVQFEEVFPIHTRFSMGLVWNPFPDNSDENKKQYAEKVAKFNKGTIKEEVEADRSQVAIALLVNIAQLSFSSGEVNATAPIDVGFGVGYRNDNFLALVTAEFTPMRTPREYFIEDYFDKDKPLILAGSTEPVRTISVEDDALFTNKIFASIGVKIAYTFTKAKE